MEDNPHPFDDFPSFFGDVFTNIPHQIQDKILAYWKKNGVSKPSITCTKHEIELIEQVQGCRIEYAATMGEFHQIFVFNIESLKPAPMEVVKTIVLSQLAYTNLVAGHIYKDQLVYGSHRLDEANTVFDHHLKSVLQRPEETFVPLIVESWGGDLIATKAWIAEQAKKQKRVTIKSD